MLLADQADRQALDQLFSVTYEELRRLASTVRRGDPSATLSPTALVNEAWLKLADSHRLATTSKLHFKRIAARAMLQLLVEAARRLDISLNRLNEIVLGKRAITADTALRLGRLLKTSAQLWMRLQADWDLHRAVQRQARSAS